MTWLALLPLLLAAAAVLFVPGGIVASVAGARSRTVVAAAPSLSVGLSAATAIVASALHVPFGVPVVAVATLLATAVVAGVRILGARRGWLVRRPVLPRLGTRRLLDLAAWLVALAIGAGIAIRQLHAVIGAPDHVAQTIDNQFHLSVVREILQTRDASSFTIERLTAGDLPPSFYPGGWHALHALILLGSGSQAIVAAQTALVCAVFLGLVSGLLALTATLLPRSAPALVATAALATCVPALPWRVIFFWDLSPNLLGISLVPGALAVVIAALRALPGRERLLSAWLLLPGIGLGLALAHPNSILTLIVFVGPLVVAWAWPTTWLSLPPQPRALRIGTATALLVGMAGAWLVLRPGIPPQWGPFQSAQAALGDILLVSPSNSLIAPQAAPPAFAVAALTTVGLVAALRRPHLRWLAGAHAVAGILWAAVSCLHKGRLRNLLVYGFYADPPRVAVLLGLTAVPLATLGWVTLARGLRALVRRLGGRGRAATLVTFGAVALASLALPTVTTTGSAITDELHLVRGSTYDNGPDAPLLSPAKLALIRRVPGDIRPGSVVATEAFNGSALLYAFTGVRETRYHFNQRGPAGVFTIEQQLQNVTTDPAVCAAARQLNVRYVLDLGPRMVIREFTHEPGFADLAHNPGVRRIDAEGDYALYEITACR